MFFYEYLKRKFFFVSPPFPLVAVRSAKFIAHENWFVAGADNGFIHVYNYEIKEKMIEFEAHQDFIRSLAVHPNLPYLLTASDDNTIKIWDWEKGWLCTQIFEGHSHYVMQVAFNPKDSNNFASASLDGTIMVYVTKTCFLVNNI